MPEPTPADRAFSTLFDAAGQARPRSPQDRVDPDVPVAATVLIVRDASDGAQVLMIQRPDRGSFAGAWVFPGGKLEDVDRSAGADGAGADAFDEAEAARAAGARETLEETGLVVDAAALMPVSCWDPPPGIPLRIRTWFFLAADPGGSLLLAPDEVISAEWVVPDEMLARHGRGEVTLYPPTWVTLHDLAEQPDATAMIDAARLGGIRLFDTVAHRGDDGPMMLWEGDAAYAADGMQGSEGAERNRLELGALPWIYRRTER